MKTGRFFFLRKKKRSFLFRAGSTGRDCFRSDQSLNHVRLCDPMNCSTPGLPVHHQLPEFTETHVHRVSDAIQPSHPMSSPFPPASNPSEHQRLPMSQQTSDESTLHMRWPKYGSFSLAACFSS